MIWKPNVKYFPVHARSLVNYYGIVMATVFELCGVSVEWLTYDSVMIGFYWYSRCSSHCNTKTNVRPLFTVAEELMIGACRRQTWNMHQTLQVDMDVFTLSPIKTTFFQPILITSEIKNKHRHGFKFKIILSLLKLDILNSKKEYHSFISIFIFEKLPPFHIRIVISNGRVSYLL